MATTYEDRINGLETSTAFKGPVEVATEAAITLSGLQTIAGVSLAAGDRVLVKNQANAVENGIWVVSTSAWSRAIDFNGSRDAIKGTIVFNRADQRLYVVTSDSSEIGVDAYSFGLLLDRSGTVPLAAFGVSASNTGAQNSAAIARAIAAVPDTVEVNADLGGSGPWVRYNATALEFPQGSFEIASVIDVPFNKNVYFTCAAPNAARVKYTGAGRDMLRFRPRTIGGDIGYKNIMWEGGDITFIGSNNGQIMCRDAHLAHSNAKGLWFCDAIYYYDTDFPAFTISGVTLATQAVVTTSSAHGFTNGHRVGIQDAAGMEAVNGTYYVGAVTSTTFKIYTDAGLTAPVNSTAFSAYTGGGIVGLGYTGAGEGAGINNNFVLVENHEFSSSTGHHLVVDASTYLIMSLRRVRFGYSGKTPLVIDASGVSVNDAEFIGVAAANVATSAFIHFPMRKVGVGNVRFDIVRFGPEDTTTFVGGDYGSTAYAPPTRYVVFGPLDGAAASLSGADVTMTGARFFGENGASTDTAAFIDMNANVGGVLIDDARLRNLPVGGFVVKETAAAAGRAVGSGNVLGHNVVAEATMLGTWFSQGGGASGWECYPLGMAWHRGPLPSIATGTSVGSGTAVITASDNWQSFRLTVTPAGSPTGTSVCTVTLPFPCPDAPIVDVKPANTAAITLGEWDENGATAGSIGTNASFQIVAPSTLVAATVYILDVRVRVNG